MEKILERIEKVIEQQIEAFEKDPLKTGIKLYIFWWIFKKLYVSTKNMR